MKKGKTLVEVFGLGKPSPKIKAHKGGRTARIGARLTAQEKAAVMAKVKADGFKSFSDWLMAQIKRG